jgi:cell division protein FtsW (lipid II flippase)
MRTHFISRLALALLGGFLVVVSLVWTGATLEWLFFAGGIAMTLIAAADALAHGIAQRTLDGLIAVLGVWTIVESLVFTGAALKWISFGGASLLVALAVTGLVIHEMGSERVVHELSVTGEREHASGERELVTA